jgi:hypothetical protein
VAQSPKGDVTVKDVADLFKKHCHRSPGLRESECYGVAVTINTIRNRKTYKQELEQQNVALRKRRRIVDAFKRLLEGQQNKIDRASALRFLGWRQDIQNFKELAAALEKAEVALLAPFDPLAGQRGRAWWHKAARMIAEEIKTALLQAGKSEISFAKGGPFVKVVTDALTLATGQVYEQGAVARVLDDL